MKPTIRVNRAAAPLAVAAPGPPPPAYPAMEQLGEEAGAKETGEEEEATREEHHREPRPHQPTAVAPDGWLAQGRAGAIPDQQREFAAIHPCFYHVL